MRTIKRMGNKSFMTMAFILVLGLFLSSSGHLWASVELSLKLSGALGYLQDGAGDIDRARKGMTANLMDLAQSPYYSTSFNWETPFRTNDFRAELVFKITPNFGISIGSGYILSNNQGSYAVDYNYSGNYGWNETWFRDETNYYDYTRKYKVSAIPITLDAYVFLPLGKKQIFNIFAHVGAGYYFGKMKHTLGLDNEYSYISSYNGSKMYQGEGIANGTLTEKTNSHSWGYQGGLGLDIKMTGFLSLGAEIYGRHVEFRDWEGSQVIKGTQKGTYWSWWGGEETIDRNDTDSAFGRLWTYDSKCSEEDKGYTMMFVRDEEPDSSYVTNVRKSTINLNSYGFSMSLKLSFNLF